MKTFPPAMQAALNGRATTHARCWRAVRRDGTVSAGDAFSIQAGCDKTWETRRVPGQEVVIGYANQDDLNDGGSLFR